MKVSDKMLLDFDLVKQPLDNLLTAMINKADRAWPTHLEKVPGTREIFFFTLNIVHNTYMTIRYICADIPKDPARKLEFAVSVPPLIRTILDSVFTIVFLGEDLPTRCEWYYKSGWHEIREELDRYQIKYVALPGWSKFLKELSDFVDWTRKDWRITSAEAKDPTSIKWWPNPGKMKQQTLSKSTGDFLRYLNDWFYRKLSSDSHLSWPGLAKRGSQLAPLLDQSYLQHKEHLEKFKSDCIFTTITLILALLSEVEVQCRFGLHQKIRYIWGIVFQYWEEAKELYDMRYDAMLASD